MELPCKECICISRCMNKNAYELQKDCSEIHEFIFDNDFGYEIQKCKRKYSLIGRYFNKIKTKTNI